MKNTFFYTTGIYPEFPDFSLNNDRCFKIGHRVGPHYSNGFFLKIRQFGKIRQLMIH